MRTLSRIPEPLVYFLAFCLWGLPGVLMILFVPEDSIPGWEIVLGVVSLGAGALAFNLAERVLRAD